MANEGAHEVLSFDKTFVIFVDESIDWFKKRARRANYFFNASRTLLIVMSASLPALISSKYDAIAAFVAVAVAILAGIDAQFRPGEQWRHHRSTQFALMRLKRAYQRVAIDDVRRAAEFPKFFEAVETLLLDETNRYWAFRITDWQNRNKTNDISPPNAPPRPPT